MQYDLHSLYIHWPFCSTKCHYCDFVAFEQHGDFQERYHRALIAEIRHFAAGLRPNQKAIKTIFIGGGTPSLYPLDYYQELFDVLRDNFDLTSIQEISMEANPADINEEKLDAWDQFGITRLSVGVQVLDDDVLFRLNRRQRTTDVVNAARLIPKYFDNFSFDFILGLPGVSQNAWNETIEQALKWPLKHISIYFLTVHEKTPLYFKVASGKILLPEDDHVVELYISTVARLQKAGYEQYEISNFALPGHQSLHNKAYWDYKHYKGFGVGACSFDGQRRSANEKNLTRYLEKIEQHNFDQLSTDEFLSQEQKKIEQWMLGLRQTKGLDKYDMVSLLDESEQKRFFSNVEILKEQQLLQEHNNVLSLAIKGMILENEVLLKLW